MGGHLLSQKMSRRLWRLKCWQVLKIKVPCYEIDQRNGKLGTLFLNLNFFYYFMNCLAKHVCTWVAWFDMSLSSLMRQWLTSYTAFFKPRATISLRTVFICRTSLGWTFWGSSHCQLIREVNKVICFEYCLSLAGHYSWD